MMIFERQGKAIYTFELRFTHGDRKLEAFHSLRMGNHFYWGF